MPVTDLVAQLAELNGLRARVAALESEREAGETRTETEWGVRRDGFVVRADSLVSAHRSAIGHSAGGEVVQRHVGPWVPADLETEAP
jgi:hypothetical protein